MRKLRHHGYVQYGCGLCAPQQWTSFDANPSLRLARIPLVRKLLRKHLPAFPPNVMYGDISKGLPVEHESCSAVYCSHVLEHLTYTECRAALRNTFLMLRAGGVFRCVLPDLKAYARRYLDSLDAAASSRFMQDTMLGAKDRPQGLVQHLRMVYGRSRHCWMWDYVSLSDVLREIGFADIRPALRGDSGDPQFDLVEDPSRWDEHSFGVHCRRPF
jgi:hypothetical protein